MKVLVIGAAGELGAGARRCPAPSTGCDVRAFVRDRSPSAGLTVDDVVIGDLRDRPASLERVRRGHERVPRVVADPEQVELETNAIERPGTAGVERIVKISNIPIAGLETGLHGNHRGDRAPARGVARRGVVPQPSFFTSVIDKQGDVIERGQARAADGCGQDRVDRPGDIAAVAAGALVRDDLDGPLHLTGPEALDGDEVAARLGVRRLDPRSTGGARPWSRRVSIRGSRTRPCTCTKRRPRRARGRDRHGGTRARPNAASRVRASSQNGGMRPYNGCSGTSSCGARPKISGGIRAQPGSPVRANAAHAARIAADEGAAVVVETDERVPAVAEVAERERDVDAVARRRRVGPSHVKST